MEATIEVREHEYTDIQYESYKGFFGWKQRQVNHGKKTRYIVELALTPSEEEKALVLSEEGIYCFFSEKNRAKVEREISPDDIVTVRGLCTGVDRRRSSFTLILKGCEIVNHIKGPGP